MKITKDDLGGVSKCVAMAAKVAWMQLKRNVKMGAVLCTGHVTAYA